MDSDELYCKPDEGLWGFYDDQSYRPVRLSGDSLLPAKFAGTDCSGLVWRSAVAVGHPSFSGNNATVHGDCNHPGRLLFNDADGWNKNAHGDTQIVNGHCDLIVDGERNSDDKWNKIVENARVGDIINSYNCHIGIVYKIDQDENGVRSKSTCKIIESGGGVNGVQKVRTFEHLKTQEDTTSVNYKLYRLKQ